MQVKDNVASRALSEAYSALETLFGFSEFSAWTELMFLDILGDDDGAIMPAMVE